MPSSFRWFNRIAAAWVWQHSISIPLLHSCFSEYPMSIRCAESPLWNPQSKQVDPYSILFPVLKSIEYYWWIYTPSLRYPYWYQRCWSGWSYMQLPHSPTKSTKRFARGARPAELKQSDCESRPWWFTHRKGSICCDSIDFYLKLTLENSLIFEKINTWHNIYAWLCTRLYATIPTRPYEYRPVSSGHHCGAGSHPDNMKPNITAAQEMHIAENIKARLLRRTWQTPNRVKTVKQKQQIWRGSCWKPKQPVTVAATAPVQDDSGQFDLPKCAARKVSLRRSIFQ